MRRRGRLEAPPAPRRDGGTTPARALPSRHGRPPDLFEPKRTLAELKQDASGCTACPLFENATQTVFGEGSAGARLMLVGEQPGDVEDREGRPFVGPAGELLDWALEKAGIDRRRAYVTNVVKHFKWVPRGKRRIHSKPSSMEIRRACHGSSRSLHSSSRRFWSASVRPQRRRCSAGVSG